MPNHEPTTTDILEAIHTFSSDVDKRFNKIEAQLKTHDQRFEKIEGDINSIKSDVKSIKSTMVTKDYLDEKLGDLRGDLAVAY